MIRLICIDVDGTLVGSSGTVLPAVWKAAERVRERGIRLAVCTGRPGFGDARGHALRLDPGGWHIFQNGASVVNVRSGQSRSSVVQPQLVAGLVAKSRRTGRILELYGDLDYAVESESPRARAHAALLGVPFRATPLDRLHGPVVRMQWLLPREEGPVVLAESEPGLERSASTSPIMPDTVFVNVTPAGVTKASAVRTLAESYGIAREDVMFVGDGDNDLGAMRSIGYPVAMGNAEPSLRAMARRVVSHVDEGGLVEALELALDTRSADG